MAKYFKYIASENRYVLEDGGAESTPTPEYKRVFDQAAVLHTTEDAPIHLTRAYNLEDEIPINDGQLEVGAKLRGQEINDISSGNHLKDAPPETGF